MPLDQLEATCGWPVSMPSASTSTLRMPQLRRDRPCPIRRRCGLPWPHSRSAPFVQRPAGDDEAADMLREMARKADQLMREVQRLQQTRSRRDRSPARRRASSSTPSLLQPQTLSASAPTASSERPMALPTSRMAERAAIADHRRGKPGAVAAVFRIDVLDHLLAPLMLEIDIDVGRLVARGADEALEQKVDLGGIDGGDAEAVADGGIGGRAAALAEDVLRSGRSGRDRDGEEIRRVVEAGRSDRAHARSRARPLTGTPSG